MARAQRPLRGRAQIGLRVGKVMGRFKMAKHFTLTITDDALRYDRNEPAIAAEAALDGIYVVRTTVGAERLSPEDVVLSYKRLAYVERAFRSLKTLDLYIRPIHHRKADRVRAHVCSACSPTTSSGTCDARSRRSSSTTTTSRAAAKAATQRTSEGAPVHSFTSLLRDLATIVNNRVQPRAGNATAFGVVTTPTPNQQHALGLLRVRCSQ